MPTAPARLAAGCEGGSKKGILEGRTILRAPDPPAAIATSLSLPEERLRSILSEAKELLYRERSRRPPPLRDEKILTAWNGLKISAYARAGLVPDDPRYVDQAAKAARFLLDNLYPDRPVAENSHGR